jgi:hypothetical protein
MHLLYMLETGKAIKALPDFELRISLGVKEQRHRNEPILLVSVHAPLCKIENNSQSENDCQRGSNGRHRKPPYC